MVLAVVTTLYFVHWYSTKVNIYCETSSELELILVIYIIVHENNFIQL